jgi:hypothetical protein
MTLIAYPATVHAFLGFAGGPLDVAEVSLANQGRVA